VASTAALTGRADRWGYRPATLQTVATVLFVAVAVSALGVASTRPPLVRAIFAVPATVLLLTVCLKSPRTSIMALIAWLATFGTIRRLLLPSGGASGSDPLLLVSPVVVGLLVVAATRNGAFKNLTTLTRNVLVLSAVILLAALNPLQGGLAVGAGGLLFVLVPVLWFWIGRGLVDDGLLRRILQIVSYLAVGAAVYGLIQVSWGFPRWDERWIEAKGYASLYVGQSVRPFASFSSSSEYVGLLAIGVVIWVLRLRGSTRRLPAVAALTILSWALVVASVRGALVVVPVAVGMTLAASRGFGFGRTALAGLGALLVLGVAVSFFDGARVSSALISRQISGLADPFDPDKSTLPLHIEALVNGLGEGVRNPVGNGLGVITIAAERFGVGASLSTDVDPSNVAVAMGIPGLLAYGAVVFVALRAAFGRARRRLDPLALAVLGVALVTLFQWLSGGNYATAPLPWLLLGWLDRPRVTAPDEPAPLAA